MHDGLVRCLLRRQLNLTGNGQRQLSCYLAVRPQAKFDQFTGNVFHSLSPTKDGSIELAVARDIWSSEPAPSFLDAVRHHDHLRDDRQRGPARLEKYGRQVFIGQEARCQRVRRGGVLFSGEWQVCSLYRNRRCRTLLRIGPSSDQGTHFTPGRHRQSNVRTDHAGIVTSRGIVVQQAITGACATS